MIELDKRDVGAIAGSRFNRRGGRKFLWTVVGWTVLFIGCCFLPNTLLWVGWVLIGGMVTTFGVFIWRQEVFRKKFVKEWEKSG